MQETNEKNISKILSRIYRDTMVTKSNDYFIKHNYKPEQFKSMVNSDIFRSVIGFLPNTKYKGRPFIMSVIYNKKYDSFEIVVQNPNVKY